MRSLLAAALLGWSSAATATPTLHGACLHLLTSNTAHVPFGVREYENLIRTHTQPLTGPQPNCTHTATFQLALTPTTAADVQLTLTLALADHDVTPSDLQDTAYTQTLTRTLHPSDDALSATQAILRELLAPFQAQQ
ncbi:hypothetical protein [Deinococcus maricopensis]|uniref:Uncharacterized protein n=1 Tax=Deinococcus maricopensis (strain DSM 21211 / LMG 22137 / NRRL B-23946 / LB-34) TaxID=709986 RepID=E8U375_DEIML|nr:hypothetical protein [Deinococcus maricopensis]ADV66020.1 hypothetical protein Deima_0359 [Deinococcus maricopensis DSM 21211]